jgi:hypothetical protein
VNFLTGAKLQHSSEKNEDFSYLETFNPLVSYLFIEPIFRTFAETQCE